MTAWKFSDASNTVVARVNADGSTESCLVSAIADWIAAGNTPLPAPVPLVADYQKTARTRIDADVDRTHLDVAGQRSTEYQATNDDAKAFKAALYAGTAPASVHCWAVTKGWTDQQACDDILATATNWTNAQQSMRANRLQKKQDVTAAITNAGVDAVMAAWAAYIATMRTNLGL